VKEEVQMLKSITISGIFVLDQDEALDFYAGKLGLEVSNEQLAPTPQETPTPATRV
jgi:catechol 2,3-dioxygenase-like lactoylglutathione lyase family enzyme